MIPRDFEPKDYYFSILFVSEVNDPRDKTQSAAAGGIATNVLLSLGEKKSPNGKISEFSAPFFVTSGPIPFQLKVQNDNSYFITTEGNVIIKNIFGQRIGKLDLIPTNILTQTSRFIPNNEGLGEFFDSPKALWNENFLLGVYTAEASISLSDQGPILKKKTTFIAIPIEIIAGFLIAIFILTVIYKRVKRKIES
ncbi:MAG: hypothetical protein HYV38_00285 [Candidatus Levybacteria bacterium]|nr:hypothetical protein [Candidatus Levybacteria bacterium]